MEMPVQKWIRAKLRRLMSIVMVLGLLTGGVVATQVTVSAPAHADVGAPPWWSGTCDSNNNPGSYELGTTSNGVFTPAEYNGVYACGPGSYSGTFKPPGTDLMVDFFKYAWGENEWECLELVMRYMYLVYGIAPYNAEGATVVKNYKGSVLTPLNNDGTSLPSPGDIISFAGTTDNPNGHTAVVTAVSVTNGSGTVTILQQNATLNGWGTLTVSGNVITTKVLGGSASGWLHNPNAASSSPPPPPPDTDGDGIPDSTDVCPTIPGPVNNRGCPNFESKVTGDFNGDGKQDIAAFYSFGGCNTSLFIFYGNGNGTLPPLLVQPGMVTSAWPALNPWSATSTVTASPTSLHSTTSATATPNCSCSTERRKE
jgi:CHAP domain